MNGTLNLGDEGVDELLHADGGTPGHHGDFQVYSKRIHFHLYLLAVNKQGIFNCRGHI